MQFRSCVADAGGRAPPGGHLQLRDGLIWILANGINVQPEKEIAHRRVAGDDEFKNGLWINRKLLDDVREVADERPLEQFPRLVRVVMNPRHHIRPAEPSRVLERRERKS